MVRMWRRPECERESVHERERETVIPVACVVCVGVCVSGRGGGEVGGRGVVEVCGEGVGLWGGVWGGVVGEGGWGVWVVEGGRRG